VKWVGCASVPWTSFGEGATDAIASPAALARVDGGLWTGEDISRAIEEKKIRAFTREKYRRCVEHGVADWNITVK
jgi:hypothetical protein